MNKQEFLNELRLKLTGKVSIETVNESIKYYEEYITAQIRMGKSEAEVLEGLGEARLIAMSIIDAEKHKGRNEDDRARNDYDKTSDSGTNNQEEKKISFWLKFIGFFLKHPVLFWVIVGIVLVLVLGLTIWIAVAILSVIWPVILVAVVLVAIAVLIINIMKYLGNSNNH